MRISSDRNDPGHYQYWSVVRTNIVTVYLDGVCQNHVIMADEETGELKRHPVDVAGNLIREEDCFKVEDLKGKVEIKLTPISKRSDEVLLYGKGSGSPILHVTKPIASNAR